jgi:hypothetical protein
MERQQAISVLGAKGRPAGFGDVNEEKAVFVVHKHGGVSGRFDSTPMFIDPARRQRAVMGALAAVACGRLIRVRLAVKGNNPRVMRQLRF